MSSAARDLAGLYPFLNGTPRDPERLGAALLRAVDEKSRESRDANARFFSAQAPVLIAAARAVAQIYRRGGRLFAMGNGGSSCDASHVTVEFMHPVTAGRPALAATNLVADTANLTALGNDVGFENVFARQIEVLGRAGDGLIGISTGGNSPDLVAAFARAKDKGLTTIGLSGGDGGRMAAAGFLDHCLVVPSDSIHRVQECHVVAYHILWDLAHTILADDRGSAGAVA